MVKEVYINDEPNNNLDDPILLAFNDEINKDVVIPITKKINKLEEEVKNNPNETMSEDKAKEIEKRKQFFNNISEAMVTADLQEQYDEYEEFMNKIQALKDQY
jgi:hypothetical protein